MTGLLAETEIQTALADLPNWQRAEETIVATYAMPTFPHAIALVTAAAAEAEAADHHPDMDIRWRRVTFALTTHDAGGLTSRDVALAAVIDRAAVGLGWRPDA
ncbi:MAG: 4a-hydroxytetrahydrobiopterin dehydratase [Candidatus Nanopelagicales bacterium]